MFSEIQKLGRCCIGNQGDRGVKTVLKSVFWKALAQKAWLSGSVLLITVKPYRQSAIMVSIWPLQPIKVERILIRPKKLFLSFSPEMGEVPSRATKTKAVEVSFKGRVKADEEAQ